MQTSTLLVLLFGMPWLDDVIHAIVAFGWLLVTALLLGLVYALVRLTRYSWLKLRSPRPLARLASATVLVLLASLVLAYPVLWVHYTYFWLPANRQRLLEERQHTQQYQDSLKRESRRRRQLPVTLGHTKSPGRNIGDRDFCTGLS